MLSGWFYRDGVRATNPSELRLRWKPVRVLYAAMYRIRPFGDLSMAKIDADDAELNRRDLSGYVCEATRIIQGGGTKGPYLFSTKDRYAVSSTGNAYVLSKNYHYLAVEYQV